MQRTFSVSGYCEPFRFESRRAVFIDAEHALRDAPLPLRENELEHWEAFDLLYRTLCGVLFNFVPTSGHPGGSISSGRIVAGLLFQNINYDFCEPDNESADVLVYAAGHKAMGLYAMWALRNEVVRLARPDLLPAVEKQLRLEDLLGFRRNPTQDTPLFKALGSRALDGHPTPATPFVRIATGASGVGVPAALGLAMAALDMYHAHAPKIHILEGEGGMTPGRVHEALAAAASAGLHNAIMHVDWNQASIDSNRVCREHGEPGDYVQWNPMELLHTHDWNVVFVPNGFDFKQVLLAQQLALQINNGQPTGVVYRTVKGWKYGVEGKASHGAGHKFCSEDYYRFVGAFERHFNLTCPRLEGEASSENVEALFYDTLMTLRAALQQHEAIAAFAAEGVSQARARLWSQARSRRQNAPALDLLYTPSAFALDAPPEKLHLQIGASVTLRGALGDALAVLNQHTHGALLGAAADLLGSTSLSNLAQSFPSGLYQSEKNPHARLIAVGGICEDAMGAFMAGLSSYGHHIGVTSSYGAFIGALEHVAARLHGIGQQAKFGSEAPYQTWIMINAHAGVKTGEDGPTHADPQVLQLLQENFPQNVLITLTPWEPQEIWPLLLAGLQARPAVLAPFVTRPPELVLDRAALGLPPAHAAAQGVYAIRLANLDAVDYHGTLVLQGNGVATAFVNEVLPELEARGLNMNVYYVASAELFNRLSREAQEQIFPEHCMHEAMGITDFTLPTMYRWVRSQEGLQRTLHSFREHRYPGSGQAHMVLREAGLDGPSQLAAILDYAEFITQKNRVRGAWLQGVLPEVKPAAVPASVILLCDSCGKEIDPREYFAGAVLPQEEMCVECEWRGQDTCAYCQAYWLNESKVTPVYCAECARIVANLW